MFFDVIAKYTDESSERLMAYIGTESTRLLEIQHELIDNHKLEYVRLELSTYWRNKRDEQGNSN